MQRYLIQLTHSDEHDACVRALRAIEQSGSHFITHADWGCKDGSHSGWVLGEFENRKQAAQIVPPEFRREARIIELNQFTPAEIALLVLETEREPKTSN